MRIVANNRFLNIYSYSFFASNLLKESIAKAASRVPSANSSQTTGRQVPRH